MQSVARHFIDQLTPIQRGTMRNPLVESARGFRVAGDRTADMFSFESLLRP
jgi:hypothetical protein